MEEDKIKHFGYRIDVEILDKFKVVCKYEGRSINAQVQKLIKNAIDEYEEKHGKIELPVDE